MSLMLKYLGLASNMLNAQNPVHPNGGLMNIITNVNQIHKNVFI